MMSAPSVILTPEQLQAVIDASGDCIKVLDLDARLLTMNLGGQQVMEIDDFQQCQNVVWTSFWEGDALTLLAAALDAARAGETQTFEGAAQTFAGTLKWWKVTVSPLLDDHGQITHLLAISNDITARKTAEDARQAAQAQLEQHAHTLGEQVRQQTQALEERATALNTFVSFTEAASRIEEVDALARLALDTLQQVLPGSSSVFYTLAPASWQPLSWSSNLAPKLLDVLQQGLPLDIPIFAELLQTRLPVFIDGWSATEQQVEHTDRFQTVAAYPVEQQGEIRAVLSVALEHSPRWTTAQQALVRAVGRSFSLLYDRIAVARHLQGQNAELKARTQVLEILASVSADLTTQRGDYALVQQVQEQILAFLPPGHAAYWEPEGERWQMKVHVNDVGNAELMAMMQAGVPMGQVPTLDEPWQTGKAFYQDDYADGMDVAVDLTKHVFAVASLPIGVGEVQRGVINFTTFQPHRWGETEQVLLTTLAQGLSLALEREEGVRQLAQRARTLAQTNQELQASNAELEAFAYSASHDLRTPVRHVQGFAELALTALNREQPDKVRRNLGVVKDAAGRMTAMIDAMLVLSRAGRQALVLKQCSLHDLVKQAQRDALLEFPEQEVQWELEGLPMVQGDAVTLQQVVTNLMSNAVKFSQGQTPARVKIWAEQRPTEIAVYVQDHGTGFDMAYADKLFGAFQRLHTQQEFSGTGIGLATVRRIVARHGGRVWAEGQVGQGATFGFSLPQTPDRTSG